MQGTKVSGLIQELEKGGNIRKISDGKPSNNNQIKLNGTSSVEISKKNSFSIRPKSPLADSSRTNLPFSYIKPIQLPPVPLKKPLKSLAVDKPPPPPTPTKPQKLPQNSQIPPKNCFVKPPIAPKPKPNLSDSGICASSSNSSPTSSEVHLEESSPATSRIFDKRAIYGGKLKNSNVFDSKLQRRHTWPKFLITQNSNNSSPKLNNLGRKSQSKKNTVHRHPQTLHLPKRPRRPATDIFENETRSNPISRTISFTWDRNSLISDFSSQYSDSASEDDEDGQSSGESKLFLTANEFYTTELRYVQILQALCEDFPKFVEKESHALHRPLVNPDIPGMIAKSLEPLLGVHQRLLDSLENCVKNWNPDSPGLAKILTEIGRFFKLCGPFLAQKSSFATLIVEACKKYPDFAAAVQAFEKKVFNGLLMIHQLDCVHQRICRYPLLLSSYMKHADHESDEYRQCLRAKEVLEEVAKLIENGLISDDDTRNLLELQRRIQSRYEIIQPGRKLLKEGEIAKHSRKELQNRTLLLFNDVLLYCAPVVPFNGNLWVRNDFDLATTRIFVPSHVDQYHSFHIIGKKRSIILVAKSTEERIAWTTAIEGALKERKQKTHYGPGDESPTDVSPTSLPLGKVAPVWVPDDRVTMCQNCQSSFTKIRRRHHCRCCGRVICGDCQGKAPLEYENYQEKNVCPSCYHSLLDQVRDGDDYVSYSGICTPSAKATLIQKSKPTRDLLLSRFRLPKNPICDTNSNEVAALVDGFLCVLEKRNWIRYWVVLRPEGVLEFYSASGDPACKKKVVLLSFDVHERSVVNGGEQVVFNLVHANQIATNDSSHVKLSFKAENMVSADRWIEGFHRIKTDLFVASFVKGLFFFAGGVIMARKISDGTIGEFFAEPPSP